MKATAGPLPLDDGWAFEIKWDGMRAVATCDRGALSLRSANGNDVTAQFPELAGLARSLGEHGVVLDGEVVALAPDGRPDFGRLQQRMGVGSAEVGARAAQVPASYLVFDLLWLDGVDARPLPYRDRRHILEALVEPGDHWRVPPAPSSDGPEWLAAARDRGLEGLVAKRLDSPYESGRRSRAWRKVKIRRRQEVVVAGWLEGEGGLAGQLGSLLVAVQDEGVLTYAGRVGSGLSDAERRSLRHELEPLATTTPTIARGLPATLVRDAHHCRPQLVVEVAFGEWTADGVLRHPSYLGRRFDVDAPDVVREPVPGS